MGLNMKLLNEHPGPCKCADSRSPNYNCHAIPLMFVFILAQVKGLCCGCGLSCTCIVTVDEQTMCSCE